MGQLLGLILQSQAALFQILATALIFGQRNHAAQISVSQAVELLLQTRTGTPQVLLASLQFLRQPLPPKGAFHGDRDGLWMSQQIAEILPYQVIQLPGRDEASWTFFFTPVLDQAILARADVVAVSAVGRGTTAAGQLADPTTDQGAEQVLVGGIMPRGKGLVAGQLGLDEIELFLTDDGRDVRHQNPLLAGDCHY